MKNNQVCVCKCIYLFLFLPPPPHGHVAFVPGGLLLNPCVATQPTVCNARFVRFASSHPCLC